MARIEELNIPMKDMWWYLDTRRFGTCPHSGFGLSFERLILIVTAMQYIRDVIPFPRTPKNAEFYMLYFFLLEEGRSRRKSGILLGFFFFGIPVFFILLG